MTLHSNLQDQPRPRLPSQDTPPSTQPVAVIGAGPAGLTAAYELTQRRFTPLVIEGDSDVGGIARTESYKGFRFDIGGHRFFTKVKEVETLWLEMLNHDFIMVPRLSRIYYRGKYFPYPLQLLPTLKNLGLYESARILLSYCKWRARPYRQEDTFEQWVTNRFGRRLYLHFFETYTEKVWGIPCTKIRADWAAQRIKNLSLVKAVINALTGYNNTSSLITEFRYPRLGPGMMWQRFRDVIVQRGGEVRLQTRAHTLHHDGRRVTQISIDSGSGPQTVGVSHVISSMPLSALIQQLQPAPPQPVIEAANGLKYRDFLIVTLILKKADPFPDNWIYIHSPDVKVGRIQNFRSWSAEMVPEPDKASIGMEYFCHQGDGLWTLPDAELIRLASRELVTLGLARAKDVIDGTVIRQPKAYPVYDEHYKQHVDTIKNYLASFENLQSVGRNGMHRYNNQDHSMLTALLAARNIAGENHDVWNINLERSYHEDLTVERGTSGRKSFFLWPKASSETS